MLNGATTLVLSVGVCLGLVLISPVAPATAAARPPTPTAPAPTQAASLSVSVSPSSVSSGGSVDLQIAISSYDAADCANESLTLTWVLQDPSGSYEFPEALSFGPGQSPVPTGGVYGYSFPPTATGLWIFSAVLSPSTNSTSCQSASSGAAQFTVGGPGGGLSWIPGWLYQFLKVTYDAVMTAIDQGIAAPIAGVLTTLGAAFDELEAPWGNALAGLGPLGPTALIFGLLGTAAACYGILGMVGVARDALGD